MMKVSEKLWLEPDAVVAVELTGAWVPNSAQFKDEQCVSIHLLGGGECDVMCDSPEAARVLLNTIVYACDHTKGG